MIVGTTKKETGREEKLLSGQSKGYNFNFYYTVFHRKGKFTSPVIHKNWSLDLHPLDEWRSESTNGRIVFGDKPPQGKK
jgi:hypothetical protein